MNNRAVVSLKCRENGNAHVQVSDCRSRIRDGKDEGLSSVRQPNQSVVSRCQILPDSAVSYQDVHFQ